MRFYKIVIVVFIFINVSCKEETTATTANNTTVPVDVDLQTGFQDKSIRVYFNQQVSFQATLSSLVSTSGPIAKFSTQLERGSITLKVRWQPAVGGINFKMDSTIISLGSSGKYYIGIEVINDSLKTKVQEVPFMYL